MLADGGTNAKPHETDWNGKQQFAFRHVRRGRQRGLFFRWLCIFLRGRWLGCDGTAKMDGAHGAGTKTVQTTDATCIIDTAVLQINTSCIAGFDATAAFDTFFRDGKFEQTDSGNDAKRCSDRADRVAEQAFTPYGKGEDNHKRQNRANAIGGEYAAEIGIRIQQFEAKRPTDGQ